LASHVALCPSQLELEFPVPAAAVDPPLRATILESAQLWPGRRSLSVVLSGCSLSCAYCCDPEHVSARGPALTLSTIVEHVAGRAADIQGVVLTGGEPTEADALLPLARELNALGVPVKLDTSGNMPDRLEALLAERLLSFVALDVKSTPERYDRLTGGVGVWERVERSIAAVLASGIDHEFRTTCYPFGVLPGELPHIASRLRGGRRLVLQQFLPRRTLDPGAASAVPYPAEELRHAAVRCSVHLPTVVREV
jgi:pyruvate formate lyase activating enzyme